MKRIWDWLRQEPFLLLMTVPAVIALTVGAAPVILMLVERRFEWAGDIAPTYSADTARAVLAAVAAGAATVLALAYSMTLVVFTLAASAIGPRLLRRFVSDRVIQISAGGFGGAFLFALHGLIYIDEGRVPGLVVTGAMALAAHAVLQLVFFARHVAHSVSIDDEVAEIAARLAHALASHRARYAELEDEVDDASFETAFEAPRQGYVGAFQEDALVSLAAEKGLVLRFCRSPGDFVAEGEALVQIDEQVDDEIAERIGGCVSIEPARSEAREIEFSIHLLVEIALRALSPGVNDPYTAVAVADALSAALADVVADADRPTCLADDAGAPRVIVPGLSAEKLIGQAFSALRSSGASSLLMAEALARAFSRIYAAADGEPKRVVEDHARRLFQQIGATDLLEDDVAHVASMLSLDLREAVLGSSDDGRA